jgi:hypothetical protein
MEKNPLANVAESTIRLAFRGASFSLTPLGKSALRIADMTLGPDVFQCGGCGAEMRADMNQDPTEVCDQCASREESSGGGCTYRGCDEDLCGRPTGENDSALCEDHAAILASHLKHVRRDG